MHCRVGGPRGTGNQSSRTCVTVALTSHLQLRDRESLPLPLPLPYLPDDWLNRIMYQPLRILQHHLLQIQLLHGVTTKHRILAKKTDRRRLSPFSVQLVAPRPKSRTTNSSHVLPSTPRPPIAYACASHYDYAREHLILYLLSSLSIIIGDNSYESIAPLHHSRQNRATSFTTHDLAISVLQSYSSIIWLKHYTIEKHLYYGEMRVWGITTYCGMVPCRRLSHATNFPF